MNWISDVTPPGLKSWFAKRETPENLWIKCPLSGELVYQPDLAANWNVTPAGAHMRMSPRMRFSLIFDDAYWESVELPSVAHDPLKFKDSKPYAQRLKQSQTKIFERDKVEKETHAPVIHQEDCMAAAFGKINGLPVTALVQDFAFMGGSLGSAAGAAFITAAQLAVARKSAFVVFTASGGARMQEGTLSLMQMPRSILAIEEVRAAGLPYIVVLCDPTSGGVSASYAMLGDVHIAEPGAMIAFTGPRVIEQTIREKLPDEFQTSEFLLKKGAVDVVCPRSEQKETLTRIIGHLLPDAVVEIHRANEDHVNPPAAHLLDPPA